MRQNLSLGVLIKARGAFSEVIPICMEGGAAAPKVTVRVKADSTMMDEDTRP